VAICPVRPFWFRDGPALTPARRVRRRISG
jgi:hypothetical protein